jgi:GTP-binding protein HflX
MHEITESNQRAILVVVIETPETKAHATIRGEELASLATTMGVDVVSTDYFALREPNSATLIGSGKVAQLKETIDWEEPDLVIFDHTLNPRVQRNLEAALDCCVIDRDEVILQIFADRAATKEAVLQVELARLEYSLPRLARRWTNLSQQRGGVRGSKGAGETQLELDRRQVQARIVQLKAQLKKVRRQRSVQRNQRSDGNIPVGAIVGYTNSGKSSLLNALSHAGVLAEDKLFATLDPTTRLVKLPGGEQILLSDTVGFVSDLPHDLVESFKSTLEEAKYADFLIIVCDASHPDMIDCYKTTVEVLDDLGCTQKPAIVMANKMDAIYDQFAVSRLKTLYSPVIETSVRHGTGLEDLLRQIGDTIHTLCPPTSYLIPASRYDLVAHIRRSGQVEQIEYTEDGVRIRARILERFQSPLAAFRIEGTD